MRAGAAHQRGQLELMGSLIFGLDQKMHTGTMVAKEKEEEGHIREWKLHSSVLSKTQLEVQ